MDIEHKELLENGTQAVALTPFTTGMCFHAPCIWYSTAFNLLAQPQAFNNYQIATMFDPFSYMMEDTLFSVLSRAASAYILSSVRPKH